MYKLAQLKSMILKVISRPNMLQLNPSLEVTKAYVDDIGLKGFSKIELLHTFLLLLIESIDPSHSSMSNVLLLLTLIDLLASFFLF